MSELTAVQVRAHVHNIDDVTVAEIIATGITEAQLKEACRLFAKDRKTHQPHDLPAGPVGKAVAIMERVGALPQLLGESGSTLA